MNVCVILNAAAGSVGRARLDQDVFGIRRALDRAAVRAELRPVHKGPELARAAADCLATGRFDAIIAAGGDGTVSAVASAMVDSPLPLGVLPMGTLNHFARDLRIPPDLQAAARVIADRAVAVVDVGDVNGKTFINNSSIGLYPRMVRQREQFRQRLGENKWLAMLLATLWVFRRYPTVGVRLQTRSNVTFGNACPDATGDARPDANQPGRRLASRQQLHCTTPFVFVGNNPYDIRLFAMGRRLSLDRGVLGVYFAHRTGRLGLFRLALRALFGRLRQARDFESMCVDQLRIEANRASVRVALDGEIVRLTPPLLYRIRPAALRVLAPAATQD
jgi:diacylglycerol kinase family enzyme